MSGNMGAEVENKKHKRRRAVLEPVSAERDSKFARALGSVDAQTRSKGLQALKLWLSKKEDINRLDLLKLWKGLFYAFWHSDKSPAQVSELRWRMSMLKTTMACSDIHLPHLDRLHWQRSLPSLLSPCLSRSQSSIMRHSWRRCVASGLVLITYALTSS